MIGSPIVFHTAPPQPASNALATWPYVLVGGPEASQKGLGLSMPAKLVFRSAICHSRCSRPKGRARPWLSLRTTRRRTRASARESSTTQHRMNPLRGSHAICCRVNDFRSPVRTIPTREHLGISGRHRKLYARPLPNRDYDHVARDRLSALVGRLDLEALDPPVADDAFGQGVKPERTTVALRELVLVVVARHVVLASAVHDGRLLRAEALRLGDRVDRRVAGADDEHAFPDRRLLVRV